jgi:hypothetical protein
MKQVFFVLRSPFLTSKSSLQEARGSRGLDSPCNDFTGFDLSEATGSAASNPLMLILALHFSWTRGAGAKNIPASRFVVPAASYRGSTLMITGSPSISPLSRVINLAALETLLTGGS